jgi:hypothetical protein
MLRIHLLQEWYSLSDPAMEEALIEVPKALTLRYTGDQLDGRGPVHAQRGSQQQRLDLQFTRVDA